MEKTKDLQRKRRFQVKNRQEKDQRERKLVFVVGFFVPVLAVKKLKVFVLRVNQKWKFLLKFTIQERFLVHHNVWFHHWRLLRPNIRAHVVQFRWGKRRTSGNLLGVGSEDVQQFVQTRRSCSCPSGIGSRLSIPSWLQRILRGLRHPATHMCQCIRQSGVHRYICSRCIHHLRKYRKHRKLWRRDVRRNRSFVDKTDSFLLVPLLTKLMKRC